MLYENYKYEIAGLKKNSSRLRKLLNSIYYYRFFTCVITLHTSSGSMSIKIHEGTCLQPLLIALIEIYCISEVNLSSLKLAVIPLTEKCPGEIRIVFK